MTALTPAEQDQLINLLTKVQQRIAQRRSAASRATWPARRPGKAAPPPSRAAAENQSMHEQDHTDLADMRAGKTNRRPMAHRLYSAFGVPCDLY